MAETPAVSVHISTCSRLHYLRESARSVLDQTWSDLELVIVDDASGDGTEEYCRQLERDDPRVRYIRKPERQGVARNWKTGFDAARGKYWAHLDDDDRYLPDFLSTVVGALESHPEARFAAVDQMVIDAEGVPDPAASDAWSERWGRAGLKEGVRSDTAVLAARQVFCASGSIFRRDALVAAGGIREAAGLCVDGDVMLRMAAGGHLAYYVPRRLAEYRRHGDNFSGGTHDRMIAEDGIEVMRGTSLTGEAERVRRTVLARYCLNLARVRALEGDLREARSLAREALSLAPTDPRKLVGLIVLLLPVGLVRRVMRTRYSGRIPSR